MTATPQDYSDTALCLWREARGEGSQGMSAVACVIRNRVHHRNSTYSAEVYRAWQFTSMSVASDPEFHLMPPASDPTWAQAQAIARGVINGTTPDVTGGATLYWNPAGISSSKTFALTDGSVVKFPATWNPAAVRETTRIGHHIFLIEV
jgi:spore germination cell wall hydrolase CwlJ-like protein